MNQKERADKLGILASTIGMIEQGRKKTSFELKISKISWNF